MVLLSKVSHGSGFLSSLRKRMRWQRSSSSLLESIVVKMVNHSELVNDGYNNG